MGYSDMNRDITNADINQEYTKGVDGIDFESLFDRGTSVVLSTKLQSSILGGYSKKSVEVLVSEIQDNLKQVKLQLERQIHDVTSEKASVVQECYVLRNQLNAAEKNLIKAYKEIESQSENSIDPEEFEHYRSENERLEAVQADYEHTCKQREEYAELLEGKEQEILELKESFENHKNEYDQLLTKAEELEIALEAAPSSSLNQEVEELRIQKQEITDKYLQVSEQMEKVSYQLEEKEHSLCQLQNQLEQEQQHFSEEITDTNRQLEEKEHSLCELQNQFEQEQKHFSEQITEANRQLEEKEHSLCDLQNQFEQEQKHFSEQITETNRQLEEKSIFLGKVQSDLTQEQQQFAMLQSQFHTANEELLETQEKLAEEKERTNDENTYLDTIKKYFIDAQVKIQTEIELSHMLVEQLKIGRTSEKEETQNLLSELDKKDSEIEELEKICLAERQKNSELEKMLSTLYRRYAQLSGASKAEAVKSNGETDRTWSNKESI